MSRPNPAGEEPLDEGPPLANRALSILAERFSSLAKRFSGIWYWDSIPAVSENEKRIRLLSAIIHLSACWMYFRPWSIFSYIAGGLAVPALLGALASTLAFLLFDLRPLRFAPAAHLALAAFSLFLGMRLGSHVGNSFAFTDRVMPMALAGAASWICATRIAALRGGQAGGVAAVS